MIFGVKQNRRGRSIRHPAQKQLVERFLQWDRVRERLARYPAIAAHYPEQALRTCSDKPPFYCHYLAWRLGTWYSEDSLAHFDALLGKASALPNWTEEFRPFPNSCDFETYWSLLWQIQVAAFFSAHGARVRWNPTGPDLLVEDGALTFFVECYSYRKSFGVEDFLQELVGHVDQNLRVEHNWCLPFSIPRGSNADAFLDQLLTPLLDPALLKRTRIEARHAWPVRLPVPSGATGLWLSLRGENHDAYDPKLDANFTGDPDNYLEVVLREVVNAKSESNSLRISRPNVLMVNCLLSPDFALADRRQRDLGTATPTVTFGTALDAVMVTDCGIDEDLSRGRIWTNDPNHPLLSWLQSKGLNPR